MQTVEIFRRWAIFLAFYIGLLTIIAAPVMKYSARSIPFLSCALIVFVTGFVVSYLFIVAWLLLGSTVGTFPSALSGVSVFLGFFVTGWLINRYVARNYGIPTKFPSLGFKVMLAALIGSWVLVGIVYILMLGQSDVLQVR